MTINTVRSDTKQKVIYLGHIKVRHEKAMRFDYKMNPRTKEATDAKRPTDCKREALPVGLDEEPDVVGELLLLPPIAACWKAVKVLPLAGALAAKTIPLLQWLTGLV